MANTSRHSPNLALDTPGGLIAVLPALLGFAPRDSHVVLAVAAGPPARVGHLLRADLDGLDEEVFARIRTLLALSAQDGTAGEFVLVLLGKVGEESARTALCARFAERALPVGARLSAALWAPSTAAGEPWQSLIGPRAHGVVPEPWTQPIYAAGVLRGDVLARDREQLRERLEPNARDRAAVSRAARRLARAGQSWRRGLALAAEHEMLEAIRLPQSSTSLAPERAARFAAALGRRETRDRLVAATIEAVTGTAELSGAELLWSQLVPMLPDQARAQAATLLALAWYARGKGAAARVALEAALDAEPEHELAQLLEACLFVGVRPSALRTLIQRPD